MLEERIYKLHDIPPELLALLYVSQGRQQEAIDVIKTMTKAQVQALSASATALSGLCTHRLQWGWFPKSEG